MEKKLVLEKVAKSPSSVFLKSDVLQLIDSIDEHPIKVYEMETKQEPTVQEPAVSLFDYLGYAAGAKLGKEVAAAAVKCNETITKKAISTRTYTGDVLMYRPQFLKEFFNIDKIPDAGDSYDVHIDMTIDISDNQNYKL